MLKISLLNLILLLFSITCFGQELPEYVEKINALINKPQKGVFSGIILVTQNDTVKYTRTQGFSNLYENPTLCDSSQFVIGSISKQFTAAIVLAEVEERRVKLHTPIRKYLPDLPQKWADTVTVHHLLTHMHGIVDLDKATLFAPGSQYNYSQIGYDLLSKIVEHTSGKSFVDLSTEMFNKCEMKHTFHPDNKQYKQLTTGYVIGKSGRLNTLSTNESTTASPVAAGAFISTAFDLAKWNRCFYEGKLLSKKTIKRLTIKQKGAVRNHPIFGETHYGYGITVDTKDSILQYGQTGFAPGFVSMNFYFPKTKTSVILLKNMEYNPQDVKDTFYYHTNVLNIVRNSELIR